MKEMVLNSDFIFPYWLSQQKGSFARAHALSHLSKSAKLCVRLFQVVQARLVKSTLNKTYRVTSRLAFLKLSFGQLAPDLLVSTLLRFPHRKLLRTKHSINQSINQSTTTTLLVLPYTYTWYY